MVAEWTQSQPYENDEDGRLSMQLNAANRLSYNQISPTALSKCSLNSYEEEMAQTNSVYSDGDQAILATIFKQETDSDQKNTF